MITSGTVVVTPIGIGVVHAVDVLLKQAKVSVKLPNMRQIKLHTFELPELEIFNFKAKNLALEVLDLLRD